MNKTSFNVLTKLPIIGPTIKACLTSDLVVINSTSFRMNDPERYAVFQKRMKKFKLANPDTAITNSVIRHILMTI